MKKRVIVVCFAILAANVFSTERPFPDGYYALRDDMYNFARTPKELEEAFNVYVQEAKSMLSGYALNVALARYEYILGRAYAYDGQNEKAALHFDAGMDYAEKALAENYAIPAQLIYAENVSANCAVRPFSWVLLWGAKALSFSKAILNADATNGAAFYMQYAKDIFEPSPCKNYKRGIKEMTELLDTPTIVLDIDDRFNILSAIGYAHLQLKNKEEAKIWLEKALEIYPGNKFVLNLLSQE